MKICIIANRNTYGLRKDITILTQILSAANHNVYYSVPEITTISAKIARKTSYHILKRKPYDINIHLGIIVPNLISYAKINCLIPNQEGIQNDKFFSQIDFFICKTLVAMDIFKSYTCVYTGFTGLDRFRPEYNKTANFFLHLSTGIQKGTQALVNVWVKNPHWPLLKIIENPKFATTNKSNNHNIDHIITYLEEEELIAMQNKTIVHLCPSIAEGFGHYIVEAMSCGAVVLTTNAPPMNELITSERGVLVDYYKSEPSHMGTLFYADEQDLENKINLILNMNEKQKSILGTNARQWYLDNDTAFRNRLLDFLGSLSI